MSIGLKILDSAPIDAGRIFKGDLLLFNSSPLTSALVAHALALRDEYLKEFNNQSLLDSSVLQKFVTQAAALKKRFTNSDDTKTLLETLIEDRYRDYLMHDLFYDLPRLRVIPNSEVIRSGISYNYQPHRDTWYGAGQSQINHWMSVENVSVCSSFYIAPTHFSRPIKNSSKRFDLDEWDTKFRPVAVQSIESENRPHPSPLAIVSDEDRIVIDINSGEEIVFSGQHLHGSSPNTSNNIRFSIDYRVYIPALEHIAPLNVDSESLGDYRKYLIKHSKFG